MKIGIADDHDIFRIGLRLLLDTVPGCEVILEAGNGNDLLQLLESTPVDLLVVDQFMGDSTGLDVLRALKDSGSPVRTILLTGSDSSAIIKEARSLGANALVAKKGDGSEVLTALKHVQDGKFYLSPEFASLVAEHNLLDDLTEREMQVLLKLVAGHSTRAIAEELEISFKTAETHRTRIMQKLDTHTVVELMQLAARVGLISSS